MDLLTYLPLFLRYITAGLAVGLFICFICILGERHGYWHKKHSTMLLIIFTLLSSWGVQKWFLPTGAVLEERLLLPGDSVTASIQEVDLSKPLMMAVDFINEDLEVVKEPLVVETNRFVLTFDEAGATIQKCEYKDLRDGIHALRTIWSNDPILERERGAFLLAFDTRTPHAYSLIDKKSDAKEVVLQFKATSASVTVLKEFIISQDRCTITLRCSVEPHNQTVKTRILFPAPQLLASSSQDAVRALVFTDRKQKLEILDAQYIEQKCWCQPKLFGGQDKYFATALVQDTQGFVSRGYFELYGAERKITAILEGKETAAPFHAELSFYCGPKVEEDLNAVDSRLTATITFGWLAPISKILFKLLKAIYAVVHNYGFAIIIMTIGLKLLLLPFSQRAESSRRIMTDVQKRLQAIDRKYKDQPDRAHQEKEELLRKQGLSAAFGGGFLLIQLVQALIIFCMSRVLSTTFELYQAPFVGWLSNLAAPDPWSVLPLLTGAIILYNVQATATNARNAIAGCIMLLIMVGGFMHVSAGVVLSLGVSSLYDIIFKAVLKRARA